MTINENTKPNRTHALTVETKRGSYLAEWRLDDNTDRMAVLFGGHCIYTRAGENDAANETIARNIAANWLNDKGPAVDSEQLSHFAWLIDNLYGRELRRLEVLWEWAGEMVHFQDVANRTGEPVKYFQRGKVLCVLHPQNVQAAA